MHDITLNPTAKIWVCEGEWAVDKLNELFKKLKIYGENIASTSGGCTSSNNADWSPLKNHKIIIWPDNDEFGSKYSNNVAVVLKASSCDVQLINVDKLNLQKAGDASDWISQNTPSSIDDIKNLPLINFKFEQEKPKKKPLISLLLSAKELMKTAVKELEYIVYPFITTQSLIMVFAKRGVGKTWFSLQLAISVALGKSFFVWEVSKPRRVLFIDGEMPLSSLQNRLKLLCIDELPELLQFLPSEVLWQNGHSLNLNDENDLNAIDSLLDELKASATTPELIIIDNLSSMTAGTDENGNSEMDTMLRWLLKLRSQGYTVLIVHHAGKNGDQRGGSRREDFLDTSIKLTEVSKPIVGNSEFGANFNIEFVKLRGLRPSPDKLKVELAQDECSFVKWKTEGADILPAYYKLLQVIRDEEPKTQTEISKKLNISAAAVSQQMKLAKEKGFVEKGKLQLTNKGMQEADKYFPKVTADL